MANLIITVIAIALVAVASLMGAYYGGSAFLNNQNVAKASTVLNQDVQLAGAWNAYLGGNMNTPPDNLLALTGNDNLVVSGAYLAQIPTVPPGAGGVGSFPVFVASATVSVGAISGVHYFAYADLGRPNSGVTAGVTDTNASACVRIQKVATGIAPASLATAAQGAIFISGNGMFGCAILSGSITNGFAGATVPSGDLVAGDYVMEYLIH